MFHKIKQITPLKPFLLQAEFVSGEIKLYDMTSLIEHMPTVFEDLIVIPKLFEQVTLDAGGYGLRWNEFLDLSSETIWEDGKIIKN